VSEIEIMQDAYILNTGSHHYVRFVKSVKDIDVFAEGRKIRYHERFSPHGTNVNFVEDHGDHVVVRTYERGVENETLACGTGVVASVICTALRRIAAPGQLALPVKVMGGQLGVALVREQTGFTDIWLEGPATFVFRGSIELP
jgi:diaminopimelate epimerase